MVKLLFQLFYEFFKVGMFTFGGGYAMISVVEDCCVERKKWITHDEMMDVTVMAESTPGPIAINMATFVGFKQAGIPGSVVATVGMVLPSLFIILCLSAFLDAALKYKMIQNLFRGIRMAVALLILNAGFNMIKKMEKTLHSRAIVLLTMTAMFFINLYSLNFSSVAVMLIAGFVSLGIFLATGRRGGKQ